MFLYDFHRPEAKKFKQGKRRNIEEIRVAIPFDETVLESIYKILFS